MEELIKGYVEVLEFIGEKSLEKFNESKGNNSKMFMTSTFASNLLTDLELIINLYHTYEVRHIASIFKTSIEHIILYGYLIKNPSKLEEYIGKEIEICDLKEDADLVSSFKNNVGQYRFKRKKIEKMAKDIGEDKSIGDNMCVYDAYRMLCDYAHDGYFMQILDDVGKIEATEKQEEQNHRLDLFIIIGLNYFNKVVEEQVFV